MIIRLSMPGGITRNDPSIARQWSSHQRREEVEEVVVDEKGVINTVCRLIPHAIAAPAIKL